MADIVNYRLERILNHLPYVEQSGLFSRPELEIIMKQREKFENRLVRRSPLKQDYLAYIDYEKQMDLLCRLRKKSNPWKANKRIKKAFSRFFGDSMIVKIYDLAVKKYKGDIDLWLQYLQFCRERKNGRTKKVLDDVLKFHPKVPGVWIYAAAWEFDHNLDATAARARMQSGLRVCPTSEDLWVEYLRMELTYLNKLKARKVALGEDEGTLINYHKDAHEKQWKEENKELFMALDEGRESRDVTNRQSEELEKKSDMFQEKGLSILQTIYSGAIEAIPSRFSLRKQFFEILEATNLVGSKEIQKDILSDMKRDFSMEPEYWDWLARLETVDPESIEESTEIMPSQLQKAVEVYEEALKFLPSAVMFNLYTKFLLDAIASAEKTQTQNSNPFNTSDHTVGFLSHLFGVYEKAEKMGCATEDLACQHVSLYLQLGRVDEARKLAEKLCSEKFFLGAVHLWVLRISAEMKYVTRKGPPSKADLLSIFEILKNVVTKVAVSEAEGLWLMALKFFSNHNHFLDKVVDISLVSLAKYGGSESGFCLSSAIVNLVLQKNGIHSAREIYKRFLALPRPGLTMYKNCIDLELNLAAIGDKDSLANCRKLFESALSIYDQDVNLWRDYYSVEIKMGTSKTAAAVSERARKKLKDSAAALIDLAHL